MKLPNVNVAMAAPKTARLEIYDDIGPSWAGMIDTKRVASDLAKLGEVDQIEVRINSRGGSAYEGLGIASVLRDHPARKIGIVEGVAASAATLPLMACDVVRIPKNAILMIHDPSVIAFGGEAEMRAAINQLAAVKKAGIALYAAKTGKSEDAIAELMTAETWYTGEEAVAAGFADSTGEDLAPEAVVSQELAQQSFNEFKRSPIGLSAQLMVLTQADIKECGAMPNSSTPGVLPAAGDSAANQAVVVVQQGITQADMTGAIANERKRVADIRALCQQAKCPELFAKYHDEGKTVAEVQAELFTKLCQDRQPADSGEVPAMKAADPNDGYKAEYKANPHLAAVGLSETDYVATRRVDDGLDVLKAK